MPTGDSIRERTTKGTKFTKILFVVFLCALGVLCGADQPMNSVQRPDDGQGHPPYAMTIESVR